MGTFHRRKTRLCSLKVFGKIKSNIISTFLESFLGFFNIFTKNFEIGPKGIKYIQSASAIDYLRYVRTVSISNTVTFLRTEIIQ